jgi:NADPH:quinone reductase-like Zn-dependent oxidoreductase
MRAIVFEKFGGPDSLVIKEIPEPEPGAVSESYPLLFG